MSSWAGHLPADHVVLFRTPYPSRWPIGDPDLSVVGRLVTRHQQFLLVSVDGGSPVPLEGRSADAADRGHPPPDLRPVLDQLLSGVTDAAASRRLGLSGRTFSRRVSEMLEHLEVATRFQAGVAVAARGWVPTSDCMMTVRDPQVRPIRIGRIDRPVEFA